MNAPIWLAVWGISSVGLGLTAAFTLVVSMIWDREVIVRISATVLALTLFSLFAVVFVQNAISTQPAQIPPSQQQ